MINVEIYIWMINVNFVVWFLKLNLVSKAELDRMITGIQLNILNSIQQTMINVSFVNLLSQAELDKMRPKLEARGAIFWELDDGAFWK